MPIPHDPAAAIGLPTAAVHPFPVTGEHYRAFAARLEGTLADDWRERHCPLIGIAAELLDCSDVEFASRLLAMRGPGLAVIGELVAEVDEFSGDLRLLLRGLALLNTRIKGGMKSAGLVLPA